MAKRTRWTIDELAHESGVTSRNIRYYQTRGLLPPPNVKGRVGMYDEGHLERLKLIQELQSEGLNLQAIGWLLGGAGSVATDELRQLKRAVMDGWTAEEPVEVKLGDLLKQMGVKDVGDGVVERAQALDLIEPTGDDKTWRVLVPGVLAAGAELRAMGGIDIDRALDVLDTMREHAAAVADAYVAVFDEAVLAPWDARGRPEDEWPAIREAVERIRPLAGEALLGVFNQVMAQTIARRVEEAVPTG